jgi:chromosome segregation ATPase
MKFFGAAAVWCSFGISGATTGPLEKVVVLLRNLKTNIENDGKQEQQSYDKFACWCEKTTDRKATGIHSAQLQLQSLGHDVQSKRSYNQVLMFRIGDADQAIDANKKAQAEAQSIREKEHGNYQMETVEVEQALAALERAILVLREGTSFLQNDNAAGASAVRAVVAALPSSAATKANDVSLLNEFVSLKASSKYAPQSATIQGILADMHNTFAADLERATLAEAEASRAFEELMAIKTSELLQLEEERAKLSEQKATNEEQLASVSQEFDDTEAQMTADIAFFDASKESCHAKHTEWTERSDLRSEELKGISDALDILSQDSSRTLLSGAIKEGKETGVVTTYDSGRDIAFSLIEMQTPTQKAYTAIKSVAAQVHSYRLAMMAVKVRQAKVGHFDKVIEAIDSMLQTLKSEDAADIEKRDQCIDQYKSIESAVGNYTWLIQKNEGKIRKIDDSITSARADKVAAEKDKQETSEQIAAMTQERHDEHAEYLQAKQDDQNAIDLLMQARHALSSYYKNHSIALGPIQGDVKGVSLLTQPEFAVGEDSAPETTFANKGSRKHEAKGIVQILTMLIEDLNDEIKNGMRQEESAQLEFEKLLKSANSLVSELETKIVNLGSTLSQLDGEKVDEEIDKGHNEESLSDEKEYKSNIKTDCDWIIGAFGKRASARTAEMNGLVAAKEFLAGYTPATPALLEKKQRAAFDDTAFGQIGFLGLGH